MIEAFIRGDNGPSRDLLAAGNPSLVHPRHPEFGSPGRLAIPTEATRMVPECQNRLERRARCILE